MHRDSIEPGIASDISTVSPKGGSIGKTSLERLVGRANNDLADLRSLVNDLIKRMKKVEEDQSILKPENEDYKRYRILYGGTDGNPMQSASLVYEQQTLKTPQIQVTTIAPNQEVRTNPTGIFEGYVDHDERAVCIITHESDDAVEVANGTVAFTVPSFMKNYHLHDVIVAVHTKGITGQTSIQVRKRSGGTDYDLLSTKATIGDEFFATDEVIDVTNYKIAEGDQLYVDVDEIHSGTPPNGLSTTLIFRK